jgi:WD40 repeat protein
MPDQETVIGITGIYQNILFQENLITKKTSYINTHEFDINTISFNKETGTLVAGGESGTAIQYNKNGEEWKIIREYEELGIESVLSSLIFKNLLILGGHRNNIRIINMREREIIEGAFETGVEYIFSIQISKIKVDSERKYLLSLTGRDSDVSENRSNVYDITGLIRKNCEVEKNIENKKNEKKELGNYDEGNLKKLNRDLDIVWIITKY